MDRWDRLVAGLKCDRPLPIRLVVETVSQAWSGIGHEDRDTSAVSRNCRLGISSGRGRLNSLLPHGAVDSGDTHDWSVPRAILIGSVRIFRRVKDGAWYPARHKIDLPLQLKWQFAR